MIDPRTLTPDEKEAFHRDAESRMKTYSYKKPAAGRVKEVALLAGTPLLRGMVQIVKDGGESNLHYHTHSDTFWMILRGKARFYGLEDKVLGDFGQFEGILIPGGARYWFEKIGDEDLEILQMVGFDRTNGNAQRINVTQHRAWMEDMAALKIYEKT